MKNQKEMGKRLFRLMVVGFILINLSFLFIIGCVSKSSENYLKTNSESQTHPKRQKYKSTKSNTIKKYVSYVSYEIQKKWEFSPEKNIKSNTKASIEFKVTPSGEITDLQLIEKSGSDVFDESVYNTIKKANPLKPFPVNILKPYIQIRITFSP